VTCCKVTEKPKGTTRLRQAYFRELSATTAKAHSKARDPGRREKIAAAMRGKARPASIVEALRKANVGRKASDEARRKMSEAHKRRGTRPPWIGPAWSEAEDQLVASGPIAESARQTGRTVGAVKSRRVVLRRLGVEIG